MSAQFDLSREFAIGLSEEAADLDAKLSAGTNAASGRTAIANRLAEADATDVSTFVNYIVSDLGADVESQLAVYTKITNQIEKACKDTWNKYLDNLIATTPKSELPEDEREKLIARRKEVKTSWDAFAGLIAAMPGQFDFNLDGITPPGTMTYLRGKRGPAATDNYQITVDGVKLSADDNNLRFLAKGMGTKKDKDGNDVKYTPRDVRDIGVSQNKDLDWKAPPAEFSFNLLGKNVTFTAMTSVDDDADTDD